MIAILTTLFSGLGRRFAYWGAIVAAVGVAIWLLIRQGKHAAEADLAIRRADARVRALQKSKDTMTDSDTRQMGLIAQDVQAVAPEAVVETEGVLRLAYGNLVGLLVEAIKDLAQEVDQLKRTAP